MRDPGAFTSPEAPLAVLCEAAGLEVIERLADGDPVETSEVEQALDALTADHVLSLVEPHLPPTDPQLEDAEPADLLLPHARRRRHQAAVHYLAAVTAEGRSDLAAAQQHLELAHTAHPDLNPATDRLARYASDRGDAARAARLWRRLPAGTRPMAELEEVQRFTAADQAPLPDRVGWLCRKATSYVERAGMTALADRLDVAVGRAQGDPQRLDDAIARPAGHGPGAHRGRLVAAVPRRQWGVAARRRGPAGGLVETSRGDQPLRDLRAIRRPGRPPPPATA